MPLQGALTSRVRTATDTGARPARRLAALQRVGMEERRRRLADRKTQLRRLYLDHTVHERQDGCIGRRGDGERRRSADSESRFFKAFCTDGVAEYPTSYQSRFMERQKPMSAQLDSHTSGLGDIVDPKLGPRIRDSQRIVEFSNHAVSAQDAQQLAERAVQVVGEAYACSHVLVVELSGQEGGQRLCAGEGWNGLLLTSAANSVETHLREGPQAGDVDARPVAAPAYWLLNRQGLDALDQVRARVFSGSGLKHGLLVSAADRTTRLGLFAGTARKGRGFSEAQARLAQGILNVLLLAVERIRGQQEHQSRLKRQIEQAKRDWEAAVDASREISQGEFGMPGVFRISDPEETDVGLKLYGVEGTALDKIVRLRGFKPMERCLYIGSAEGERGFAKNVAKNVRRVCKAHGAMSLGGYAAKRWEHGRYTDPYMREDLNDYGIIIDTLEAGVTWDNLHRLHQGVRSFVKARPRTICMTHASHFYPQGTNLYFIFIVRMNDVEEYKAFQAGIIDQVEKHGGSLSHHHGVGRMMAPWMERHLGTMQMDVLRALKRHFDPKGIMNPGGTLGLDLPPA